VSAVLEELQPAVSAATAVRDVRRASEAFTLGLLNRLSNGCGSMDERRRVVKGTRDIRPDAR
jgi:hypothetical protein